MTPPLYLAPMEGVGDLCFRRTLHFAGGVDHFSTEFIRVPKVGPIDGIVKKHYYPVLDSPIPHTIQFMGTSISQMIELVKHLGKSPRLELNCGCPSSTVTGKGAGSALLEDPERLGEIVQSLRDKTTLPLSVKMRSGVRDTQKFPRLLEVIQEAGADSITLHPRTKKKGYRPTADWSLYTKAKKILHIPLIASGDIFCAKDAHQVWNMGVDGLMVGRGAVADPLIFRKIKNSFGESLSGPTIQETVQFYFDQINENYTTNLVRGKTKQIIRYSNYIDQDTKRVFLRDGLVDIKKAQKEILERF